LRLPLLVVDLTVGFSSAAAYARQKSPSFLYIFFLSQLTSVAEVARLARRGGMLANETRKALNLGLVPLCKKSSVCCRVGICDNEGQIDMRVLRIVYRRIVAIVDRLIRAICVLVVSIAHNESLTFFAVLPSALFVFVLSCCLVSPLNKQRKCR
jgi:hypothetical protein